MIRGTRVEAVGLACFAFAGAVCAQQPLGPDLQANTYTTSAQVDAKIAVEPDGGFRLVWSSSGSTGSDSSDSSIQVRAFDAAGEAAEPEFQVNQYTPGIQRAPVVAIDDDGEFTVVWALVGPGTPTNEVGAVGRRLAADSAPLGAEFTVATSSLYSSFPALAGRPDGSFVVVRDSNYVVEGVVLGSSGTPGADFTIGTADEYLGGSSAITLPANGFIVAWGEVSSLNPDYRSDIRMQRFDESAQPTGDVIDVTGPATPGARFSPEMALNAEGNVLVVWQDDLNSSGTGDPVYSVHGRAFGPAGSPLGPSFRISEESIPGDQRIPRASAAADGSFIVTWQDSPTQDLAGGDNGSSSGIRARHLAANGEPLAPSFLVNSYVSGNQSRPDVGVLSDGTWVFAWQSQLSAGSDTSGASIQFRRFHPAFFADGFESGDTSGWSAVGG
jgi:hypothetical protein